MLSRRFRRPQWLAILGIQEKREELARCRVWGLSGLALVGLAAIILLQNEALVDQDTSEYARSTGRQLLSTSSENTTSRCIFEKSSIPGAWLFAHCIFILIIFIALAIICDDFFVPSLEIISEKLNLSEDVAGATFMAAGSSAPELFTSVAGVAQETDVGVGTIVGSAVFNLLIIIALTAALAGKVLELDWRPMARDSFFYAMSIGCFIGFAWDGYFQHYEAAILLSLYVLYIILMIFNPRIVEWMGTWRKCCKKPEVSPSDDKEKSTEVESQLNHKDPPKRTDSRDGKMISMAGGHARRLSLSRKERSQSEERIFHHKRGSISGILVSSSQNLREEKKTEEEEESQSEDETIQLCPCCPCCPAVRTHAPSMEQIREEGGCVNWLKFILRWIIFIPAFPFVCLFSWTIPDCSKEHLKKYYLLSFFMSVVMIAGLSYAMVTIVERVGCILGIDSYIMGLVVVAIGTSIPDALSSILVARDGYGDMAVSNAIGSNVFDINLGLGLPFIIRIAIDKGAPITLLDSTEWVHYFNGKMVIVQHAKFGFILLLILFLALLIFGAVRFKLNKWIGISFVIIYVIFLTYAFTQELYCIRKLDMYC